MQPNSSVADGPFAQSSATEADVPSASNAERSSCGTRASSSGKYMASESM
eukprot:CAMPEP_0172754648 /NCGR_PEP_ID=MMETSP1074-20121228/158365_1 /TAXON_ID=2916 /ORGANISM="Ceratium fusus, Strain PA161109" /LENGTH=49 /DNA_ID= /DNA_START= /DNA_END= /DNA_ORIENTATION=